MQKLRLDDLHVDSFSTAEAQASFTDTGLAVAYPYSLLGSCYGCPTVSDVTICPATYAVA